MRICLTGGIACGKSLVARFLNDLGVETIDADDVAHEIIPDPAERRRLAAEVFADPAKRKALEAKIHPLVRERIEQFLSNGGNFKTSRICGGRWNATPLATLLRNARCARVICPADIGRVGVPPPTAAGFEITANGQSTNNRIIECSNNRIAGRSGDQVFESASSPSCLSSRSSRPYDGSGEGLSTRDFRLSVDGAPLRIAIVPLLFETRWNEEYDIICCVVSERETQISRMTATRGYSREEAEARLAAQMPVAEKAAKSHYVINNNGTAEELRMETGKFVNWLKEK